MIQLRNNVTLTYVNLPNTTALKSTPAKDTSTRNIFGSKGLPAGNHTAICEMIRTQNMDTTLHNPMSLHGVIQRWLHTVICMILHWIFVLIHARTGPGTHPPTYTVVPEAVSRKVTP
jgi:hypothetical protein